MFDVQISTMNLKKHRVLKTINIKLGNLTLDDIHKYTRIHIYLIGAILIDLEDSNEVTSSGKSVNSVGNSTNTYSNTDIGNSSVVKRKYIKLFWRTIVNQVLVIVQIFVPTIAMFIALTSLYLGQVDRLSQQKEIEAIKNKLEEVPILDYNRVDTIHISPDPLPISLE